MNSTTIIEIPKPGAFYRHFKGDPYFIIGMARYSSKYQLENKEQFVVYTSELLKFLLKLSQHHIVPIKHSETEEILSAYCENGNWLIIPGGCFNYESLGWARPLNKFMEALEDGSPRFELIAQNLKELK